MSESSCTVCTSPRQRRTLSTSGRNRLGWCSRPTWSWPTGALRGLHDVNILDFAELDVIPALDAVSTGGKGRSKRRGVFGGKRDLVAGEIMTLASGVRVTTPLRTACDLACLHGRYRAIAERTPEQARKRRYSRTTGAPVHHCG